MDNVNVRPARAEEIETLIQFEQGIVEAERPFDPRLKAGEIHYYDLLELIESSDAEVIVATVNDEPVGSGYIQKQQSKPYKTPDYYGYIGFMYVDPNHRGKGIVQVITDALLGWAKSKGLTEIKLEVYDENEPAVRAYEKAGFTKCLVEMRRKI